MTHKFEFYAVISSLGKLHSVETTSYLAEIKARYRNEDFEGTGVKWVVAVIDSELTSKQLKELFA